MEEKEMENEKKEKAAYMISSGNIVDPNFTIAIEDRN